MTGAVVLKLLQVIMMMVLVAVMLIMMVLRLNLICFYRNFYLHCAKNEEILFCAMLVTRAIN